jgi:hypothetical protein
MQRRGSENPETVTELLDLSTTALRPRFLYRSLHDNQTCEVCIPVPYLKEFTYLAHGTEAVLLALVRLADPLNLV